MSKKLLFLISFIFFTYTCAVAQEMNSKKYLKRVYNEYVEKLQLNKEQSKKMKSILKENNAILEKLIKEKKSKQEINKQLKLNDLAVYKILSKVQFVEYKKLKEKVEPKKKYRFEP